MACAGGGHCIPRRGYQRRAGRLRAHKGSAPPGKRPAFLDFVLSRDVQELLVSDLSRRSVRTDVHAPEDLPSEAELGIIDYDVHWASSIKEEFIARWTELCGVTS